MQNDRNFLHNIYLFKNLTSHELDSIAAIGRTRPFAAGDTIFLTGEKATALYLIIHGLVKIQHTTKNGETVDVNLLETGTHFGEMSFVDNADRAATALATERGELMEIPYDGLAAVLEKYPNIAIKFYRELAHFLSGRLRIISSDLTFMREKNMTHI